MRKPVAAALIGAAVSTSACGQSRAEDAGPTISRSYPVGAFQQIETAGPYDIQVRTGGQPAVSARGSQKLLEHTVVEVKGDKLIIRPERQKGWFHVGRSTNGKAIFTITVPQLTGATLAGAGDMTIDRVQGNRFEGRLAGAGDLHIGAIDVQMLKLAIAGAGDVRLGNGKAQAAEYDIAGHGDLDARSVATEQAKVSIAGAGSVRAHSSGIAEVNIVGAGDVDISGGAKCSVHKMGAGDVRCS